jgi:hypothetical protein
MIAKEIISKAGKKYKSTDWYVNSLLNELRDYQKKNINQLDTKFITPGDFIFFLYSAQFPQKYKFWDQHPMVYVIDVQPNKGFFLGSNVHYINPSYRKAVVSSYLNRAGSINAPRITLHNYLFANVITDFYKVPENDWVDVALLPTERFVDRDRRPVPKYKIWSYSPSQSSP